MPIKKPEEILDEHINRLRKGDNFEALIKQISSRALRESLDIAFRARQIPTRSPALDQTAVWNAIIKQIRTNNPKPQTALAPSASRSPFGFSLHLPKTVFAGILIVVMLWLVNSTAVAAQNSLPGQTLYPVKRTVEKIQLTLTIDDVKKTEVRIKHAENRLTEAKTIIESNPAGDEEAIEQTLNDLKDTTAQVADESSDNSGLLIKVVELTDKQENVLSDIETKVSGDAKKIAGEALDAAVETKFSAEKNLAELQSKKTGPEENAAGEDNSENASTTPEIEIKGQTNEKSSTSTDSPVQTLGSPEASSTIMIIESLLEAQTETTTPEIVELK